LGSVANLKFRARERVRPRHHATVYLANSICAFPVLSENSIC
jgi:hypothetical protein